MPMKKLMLGFAAPANVFLKDRFEMLYIHYNSQLSQLAFRPLTGGPVSAGRALLRLGQLCVSEPGEAGAYCFQPTTPLLGLPSPLQVPRVCFPRLRRMGPLIHGGGGGTRTHNLPLIWRYGV